MPAVALENDLQRERELHYKKTRRERERDEIILRAIIESVRSMQGASFHFISNCQCIFMLA